MAAGRVTISRDGPQTPWGFRLHGGKDIGYPMVIQRVFLGSPSESELQRGDMILQVQGYDTVNLTHMEAYDLIKAAGTTLQLLIRRLPDVPKTPTSPVILGGMHQFPNLLPQSQGVGKPVPRAPMFQPMSPPRVTPKTLPTKQYCYSPLPFTPIPDINPFARTPKNLADSELIDYHIEKRKEKNAMLHQGYRTLPLITPKPKTCHDMPMGSYLRFTPASNWKTLNHSSEPVFLNKYPTPTYPTIGVDSNRDPLFERGSQLVHRQHHSPLGSQLVHRQYNSPLFLYSQKNVEAAAKEQEQPHQGKFNATQAGPGTKLTNIVDITLSPTFQMLQEEEKSSSHKSPTVIQRGAPKPITLNKSRAEVIQQSGSFKTLMSAVFAPQQEA